MSNTPHFERVLASTSPKICVIAGPGSGKTKGIIIPKAKSLIEAGIDPKQVLLLSFSRLSALDLKKRVQSLDKVPKAATVHSFCLGYLLTENDHGIRDRIGSVVMDFELDYLIDDLKIQFTTQDKRVLRKRLTEFSAAWARTPHDEVFETDEDQRRFKAAIINWLSEHGCVLMEEIVYFALDHIKKAGKSDSLDNIKYIFVDEYQDLNKLEQEFINIIAEGGKLLVTVGDPDQSIYSFKFAWKDGIKDFFEQADVEGHPLPYCGRCAKNILEVANKLLIQEVPGRTDLPLPLEGKEDGVFDLRPVFNTQNNEFQFITESITEKINAGISPDKILVLIPKYKLGEELLEYVQVNDITLPNDGKFELVSKPRFTSKQQERILQLALLAKEGSVLHTRSYIGLNDGDGFAKELNAIKGKYGNWETLLANANPDDFPPKNRRIRGVCQRIIDLRNALAAFKDMAPAEVIDNLFPVADADFAALNGILKAQLEEGDTITDVLNDFIDYTRTLPDDPNTVRIMTIMASKGLEAPHVFMIGCNAGNIPGTKRSAHLSDFEHEQEQRRFLYVGFTRAQETLTVTWSRHIPYEQSLSHSTAGVSTTRINGELMTRVGISKFLQDLN